MKHTIALFGEAEKGRFQKPHIIKDLVQLVEALGHPPLESEGLFFAIQALLYKREIVYFRVLEEGFSSPDYFQGMKHLEDKERFPEIRALCLPGVGDESILRASEKIRQIYSAFLITNQKDMYDYLTS
ncbi:MAG: hypothetical protein JSS32_00935 [Verrucomicrobia bacterium]|nr:hypothetical protein [Verrucomicrobiota bacterium]